MAASGPEGIWIVLQHVGEQQRVEVIRNDAGSFDIRICPAGEVCAPGPPK